MRRYFLGWTLLFVLLLAGVAVANIVVDPYSIYRFVQVRGFNEFKPRAQQQGRLMKVHGLIFERPRALILGNSRAEMGFDPQHRAWPQDTQPVFNAALPGTGLTSALDFVRREVERQTPRTILLGLDFKDFLFDARKASVSQVAPAQQTSPLQHFATTAKEFSATVLSLDALIDSALTITAQRDPYPADLRADGFNPLRNYIGIAKNDGYYAMFRQRNLENAKAYGRGAKDLFAAGNRSSPDFETLDAIIRLCRERGIALKLIIYPYHAHLLETLRAAGLWSTFEEWKRVLANLSGKAGNGENAALIVWDFSGYHAYATETVPLTKDRDRATEVHWYWEAGHFKKELGDIMLDRILSNAPPSSEDEFGVVLTPNNIERHLATLRQSRERYAGTHPEDVHAVETMVAQARR